MERGDLVTVTLSDDFGKPRIDKPMSLTRDKIGRKIGGLDATMLSVTRSLAIFLGFARRLIPKQMSPGSSHSLGQAPLRD